MEVSNDCPPKQQPFLKVHPLTLHYTWLAHRDPYRILTMTYCNPISLGSICNHNPLNYVKKKMKVFWLLRCSHKPLPKFQIVIPLVSLGMAQWVRIRNIISKYYTKCHVVITLKKTVPRFFPVTQTRVFYSWPFQGWKRDLHLGDQKVTTGRSWTPEITSQNSHLGLRKKVAKQTTFLLKWTKV